MGRKLRYLPEGGALVEVTCRTLQGRLRLRELSIRPFYWKNDTDSPSTSCTACSSDIIWSE